MLGQYGNIIFFYIVNGPFGDFSNFAAYLIEIGHCMYKTSEHYFQVMKYATVNPEYAERIRKAGSPGQAARLGRSHEFSLRPDWEQVKDQIMYTALTAKFIQHDTLHKMLLQTGTLMLVEHTKNDRYWGDGSDGATIGTGKNMLGKLLMTLRTEFQSVNSK